ncbi:MAG TPA: hypothetical protein VFZ18_07450 [Longimicrobiaceae bacterium]
MPARHRMGIASLAAIPLFLAAPLSAQVADAPPDTIAAIPVNYTEALAGTYRLPDPLVMSSGAPVRDAQMWARQRRPELIRLFEEHQYGRSPGRPAEMVFDVFDAGTPALAGKATRRQVTLYFNQQRTGPTLDVLLYLPAAATGPVPVFLNVSFSPNSSVVDDPGIKPGQVWNREARGRVTPPAGRGFGRLDVVPFLDAGIGVATVYYADLDPDFLDGATLGIRGVYMQPGQTQPAPHEWGSIAAWSWGLSRVMDYFETDEGVDEGRVALFGASRVGKTVLWTAARDPRFAAVIASASGEGGAALSRRNYGETIAHLVAPTRYPYQFAGNYARYGDRVSEFPVDAHLLLALIAPRPVLLQTGTEDRWSDPRGEFLAAVAAEPVFELLGAKGLGTTEMPAAGEAILNTIGYVMHEGGHGPAPADWPIFLEFTRMHLLPAD